MLVTVWHGFPNTSNTDYFLLKKAKPSSENQHRLFHHEVWLHWTFVLRIMKYTCAQMILLLVYIFSSTFGNLTFIYLLDQCMQDFDAFQTSTDSDSCSSFTGSLSLLLDEFDKNLRSVGVPTVSGLELMFFESIKAAPMNTWRLAELILARGLLKMRD